MANSSAPDSDIQSLTVADLIVRLRDSAPDEASAYCEEVIRRFEPLLRGTWRRLSVTTEYQDFVQDVFVQLFKYLRGLEDPGAFPSYFRHTVISTAISTWRRSASRITISELPRNAAHEVISLDEIKEITTQIDEEILTKLLIRSYLERLPQREQTVLSLEFFAGLTLKEIAKVLEVSEGNTRLIKHRALKSIRQMIRNDAAGSEVYQL